MQCNGETWLLAACTNYQQSCSLRSARSDPRDTSLEICPLLAGKLRAGPARTALPRRSQLDRMGWRFYVCAVRILFIGDIVGKPGRRAARLLVPILKERLALDVVVANGENSAGGSGITPDTAREILEAGVDAITTGDHLWDKKEVISLLDKEPRFVRPLNYPPNAPGQGSTLVHQKGMPPLAVVNAQGRTFMKDMENPFLAMEQEVARLRERTPIILVDFHAEATSDKIAMGRFLDGKVSAVIGTHTHVQTADEQIFPGGTAFLCDAGFTGPHESILGREIDPVVRRFLTSQPQRFGVAKGRVLLQGAWVEVDNDTGRALNIQRVSEPLPRGAN